MKIGFIGAGKVAASFGRYLSDKGLCLCGYYSRTIESARNAAEYTDSRCYKDINEFLRDADIVFITTNDDCIKEVCNQLVNHKLFRSGQIIIHMSGALPSSILNTAHSLGCYVYSMHPLQSFADVDKASKDLADTFFSIEGDSEKLHVLEDIMKATGNRYFIISPKDKILYHAAACIFSNYLTTLMHEGLSFFNCIGINSSDGFEAVLPLILGTISNIRTLGTETALTGPIARGDAATIRKHLTAITDNVPEKLEFYKHMAQNTIELAKHARLTNPEKIKNLEHLFDGGDQ